MVQGSATSDVRRTWEHVFVRAEDCQPDGEQIRCMRCGLYKPSGSFNWRRRALGQRDSYCRPCRAEYKHEHYSANRQRYIEQAATSKQKLQRERMVFLIELLRSYGLDCGETDPLV